MRNKVFALFGGVVYSASIFALPEVPVIDRSVHMTENREYINPTVPALTTSADSRVAMSHRVTGDGFFEFRLMVPEKIDTPFMESTPGTTILSQDGNGNATGEVLNQARVADNRIAGIHSSHSTLCDPSGNDGHSNPRACGADDCYDLHVIRMDGGKRLWGTEVMVRVSAPKTPQAQIAEVRVGEQTEGHQFPGFGQFFEPVVTSDGHLMSARKAGGNFDWIDSAGQVHGNTNVDNVYFINDNPDEFEACDVRQWDKVLPLSHAPYDTTINQRYGFAMQLFRDYDGSVVPELNGGGRAQFWGSYPWLDKDGDNLSFVRIGTDLLSRYGVVNMDTQVRCVEGTGCTNPTAPSSQNGDLLQGRAMVGLWTRGKIVLLDNMINNIDYGTKSADIHHREIQLYEGESGWTRVGNGRDNFIDEMPITSPRNTSFFDSNEHRFNYHHNMKPVTPADVTWLMSSGRGTDEVKFDDYLNPNSFINANMAQRVSYLPTGRGPSSILQNAATGGRVTLNDPSNPGAGYSANGEWILPAQGNVLGSGRIEPVAKGGIHGKGFWLDGHTAGIRFPIPAQTRNIDESPWYYSIFIDPRNNVSGQRSLITFPDGSEIRVRDSNAILLIDDQGNTVREVISSQALSANAWSHIAVQIGAPADYGMRDVTTYVNGFPVDRFSHDQALFRMVAGDLTVGLSSNSSINSFTGWVDEFKVFAEEVNVEVACNHAAGTLAGISGDNIYWSSVANGIGDAQHLFISDLLGLENKTSYERYVCYHDYSDDYAAHLSNLPNGLTSIRDDINFPEGPLFVDRPRPDSVNNRFCLSCHEASGGDGLGLGALTLSPGITAPHDPRRQPMQPDPVIFGHIPANWLGEGRPAEAIVTGPEGFLIDNFLLANAGSSPTPADDPVSSPAPILDPVSGNLIENSNLESGSLLPWTASNANASVSSNSAHSGNNAIHINGSGSAYQEIVVEPDTRYTLRGWARVAQGGQSVYLGVKFYGGADTSHRFTSVNYRQASISFTTGADNTSARIYVWSGDANQQAWADDISVTKDNLLANGSFEDGDDSGWGAGGGNASIINSNAQNGEYAAYINGTGSVAQIIDVEPNTTYRLSAWGQVGANGQAVFLGVRDHGNPESNLQFTSPSYQHQSLTFTTGASATTARIYYWCGNASYEAYGDNFVVTEVQ
ncbi:carbohydrate binding domain-containing protein [Microbulbifer elongatus]|uniref:Carbohydrate binding domain-containing protein n=1 Tax=Microbulbifer elongatus TaxID=86173 RepID=A0ABT1P4H7_9GAMM|nr:carbohydrate binding domain-containing protein [Microbulbifer elongatus]MCQ3831005.1 carbohydrate binding domain-containing protein [Microbulbifer elongatus]